MQGSPSSWIALSILRDVCTTNTLESMHMQPCKIVKNRGHIASDEAASKLRYLAIKAPPPPWEGPPGETTPQASRSYGW